MSKHSPELLTWLAALRLPRVGSAALRQWLALSQNMQSLFSASDAELNNAGLNATQIASIKHPDWKAAQKDLSWCEQSHCEIVTYQDNRYPDRLKEIHSAPMVLFAQGDINLLNVPQIAIVGSRNPSQQGKENAYEFARYLAAAGFVITSGLALGIDAYSHRGTLAAGGKTIAVCGTGLKTIYPASHRKLGEQIKQQGLLLSEFTPDVLPQPRNFPRRNRIISGLSLGTLVVEAALRSGSLITARLAAEQGREVFAIPGSIHNPLTRGCHQLIKDGAKIVETAQDILEEFGGQIQGFLPINEGLSKKQPEHLDKKTRAFLAQIGYEVTSFNTIISRSGLTAGEVSSMLLTLELQGYIRTVLGGYQLID